MQLAKAMSAARSSLRLQDGDSRAFIADQPLGEMAWGKLLHGLADGPAGGAIAIRPAGSSGIKAMAAAVAAAPPAPIVDLNGAGPGTSASLDYTENQSATPIAPAATVTDADSPDFDTGVLTVAITANGTDNDRLIVIDQGTGVGQISVGEGDISYNFGHVDDQNNPIGPESIGTYSGGDALNPLTVTFNANATPAAVQALVRLIAYLNSSEDPSSATRTLTYTLSDGDGNTSDPAIATIGVTPVADPAIANNDTLSTDDNVPVSGSVFSDNGNGNDYSPDGSPFQVTQVNGSAAAVGMQITLASGALLTLNADGTYAYDPNGQFNALVPQSSGAVNFVDTDSFTYTISGGSSATATVVLTGIVSPGDIYKGDGGDNFITGTSQADIFRVEQGGNDTITAGGGNDIIYYGAALTSADNNNGGSGTDVIVLQGNYDLTFGAQGLVNVEIVSLQSGSVTKFGDVAGNSYDYGLTTLDSNVAAGRQLVVNGQSLLAGEDLNFDGSAETDGTFFIYGGHGTDTLTGGAGNDIFFFEGTRWNNGDTVDGGGGRDSVVITGGNGVNHIEIGAGVFANVESVSVNGRFATDPSALPSYELVIGDNNISGGSLIVNASSLGAGQQATLDGSAVTEGSLQLFGGAGADVLIGGNGSDMLYGGLGPDLLTGGAGNDVFRYDNVAQSVPGGRDGIRDFASGDLIDLGRIDAISGTAGNDAFTFIGSDAFGGHAGELRAVDGRGGWTIQGDTNGDGVADFELVVIVTDAHPIGGADFVL